MPFPLANPIILGIMALVAVGTVIFALINANNEESPYGNQRRGPRPGQNGPRPGQNDPRPRQNGPRPGQDGPRPRQNGPRPGQDGPRPGQNGPRPGQNDSSTQDNRKPSKQPPPNPPSSLGCSKEDKYDNCCICYYPLDPLMTLPCGHTFHHECISGWIPDHKTCPICRGFVR